MYPHEILFPHKDMLGAVRLRVAAICAMLDCGEFEGVRFPNSEHYPYMTEYGFAYEDAPSYLNPQTFFSIEPRGQLARAIERVISSMGKSISNGQLVPVQLRVSFDGAVDDKNTWLRLNDVIAWLKDRNIAVGELFDILGKDEQRIVEAALMAADSARLQIESENPNLICDKSVNEYLNSLREQVSHLLQPDDPEWTKRMETCLKLIDDIKFLETENRATFSVEDPLNTRVRNNLLKLVIGMAINGYKYAPKDTKSEKTMEITEDVKNLGMDIGIDTVRKYLNEAVETVLPAKHFSRNAKPI